MIISLRPEISFIYSISDIQLTELIKIETDETHMSTTRSQKPMNRVKRAHEHLELTKLMNNKE